MASIIDENLPQNKDISNNNESNQIYTNNININEGKHYFNN